MKLEDQIPASWRGLLAAEFSKNYFRGLCDFVSAEYREHRVYPPRAQVFRALELVAPQCVKVVILGQDPYHGVGQAMGLSFSVPDGVVFPPSLRNIFREVVACGYDFTSHSGSLERWASQGVLLLNSVLTVRAGEAASHAGHGWEDFTSALIREFSARHPGVVYMLWGAYAQRKGSLVDGSANLVLTSAHPSPLSANRGGWFGCGHFSAANLYLESSGRGVVEW